MPLRACWRGEHWGMVSYAVTMCIIYPFGTPLLYAAMEGHLPAE